MSDIPIQNLYYMLCYAWRYLEEGKVVPFDAEPTTALVDLFAKVLTKCVHEMQRRGLHRIYAQYGDEIRALRGKLDIGPTLNRMLLQEGKVGCLYSELTTDSDLNRIIKATSLALMRTDELDHRFVQPLRDVILRMGEVQQVDLDRRLFKRIRFDRLTEQYRPTIKICELIFEQLLPKEEVGRYFFRDFVRDEDLMHKVFEEFVRNFLDIEQSVYPTVRRERFSWQAEGSVDDIDKLPMMETDISLIRGDDRIVVETKYYADALVPGRSDKETVRSGHLYQLASYLQNLRGRSTGSLRGILLYPALGRDVDLSYRIWGIPLQVKTISLDQDWKSIHEDLLGLIEAA